MATQVQLPGGKTVLMEVDTVEELLRRAFEEFAPQSSTSLVPASSARVVDAQSGYVLPNDAPAPQHGRVVTTGAYGAQEINQAQLALDMLVARKSQGYGERYTLSLLSQDTNKLVPFRAYFWYDKWWPTSVYVQNYPFVVGEPYQPLQKPYKNFVWVVPDGLLPMCPVHKFAFHPHVSEKFGVCFGSKVRVLPGNGIINLCEAVFTLLENPYHDQYHLDLCLGFKQ